MTVDPDIVGKTYPAFRYAIGREKVVEYALATGERDPLHLDVDAARAAGHADVVAPPMFVVVYQGRGVIPVLTDPELGIDFSRLLHSGQEFRWGPLVVAGDEIETTVTVAAARERAGLQFFDFSAESVRVGPARPEVVATGTWRNVVRPAEER